MLWSELGFAFLKTHKKAVFSKTRFCFSLGAAYVSFCVYLKSAFFKKTRVFKNAKTPIPPLGEFDMYVNYVTSKSNRTEALEPLA